MNLEIIFFTVSLFIYLAVGLKQVLQIKVFKTHQIIVILHLVTLGVLLGTLGAYLFNTIDLLLVSKILRVSVGFIFSLYLTATSLIAIQSSDARKTRTLWRIPLVGLLAATYFEFKYVLYIALGNIFLTLLISMKQKEHFRYLRVKALFLLIPGGALFIINLSHAWTIMLFALCCLLFSWPLLNLTSVNGLLRSRLAEK